MSSLHNFFKCIVACSVICANPLYKHDCRYFLTLIVDISSLVIIILVTLCYTFNATTSYLGGRGCYGRCLWRQYLSLTVASKTDIVANNIISSDITNLQNYCVYGVRQSPIQVLTRVTCDQWLPTQVFTRVKYGQLDEKYASVTSSLVIVGQHLHYVLYTVAKFKTLDLYFKTIVGTNCEYLKKLCMINPYNVNRGNKTN